GSNLTADATYFLRNQNASAQAASAWFNGTVRMGNETGTGQPAGGPMIVRRLYSTITTAGNAIAITPDVHLERDGTNGGLRYSTLNANLIEVNCTGITSAGAVVGFHAGPAAIATATIFTDAQAVVHYDCSISYAFGAGDRTLATFDRRAGDWYWMGFLTSTFN